MATTAQKSAQETNRTASPPVKIPVYEQGGKERIFYFNHAQVGAGDAGSTVDLVTLPPGKWRLCKNMSHVSCSAFGASRTLDIGYTAYTAGDGSAVSAGADKILDGGDVSAIATLTGGAGTNALTVDPTILFDSKTGVLLQAVVAGGTIPDAATLKGYFTVVHE